MSVPGKSHKNVGEGKQQNRGHANRLPDFAASLHPLNTGFRNRLANRWDDGFHLRGRPNRDAHAPFAAWIRGGIADDDAAPLHGLNEWFQLRTDSDQNKIRLAGPETEAEFGAQLGQLLAAVLYLRDVLTHESLIRERFFKAGQGRGIYVEWQGVTAEITDLFGCAGDYAESKAGEAVRFRKRACDEDVGVLGQVGQHSCA